MIKKIIGVLLVAPLLVGCATKKTTYIYNWDGYQKAIYEHYQQGGLSADQQITSLQELIEKSRAKDKPVPPGLHAHLGMLYAKTAKVDQAFAEFEIEKTLFPESTPFMDFLLTKDKGKLK
jgi:hypothetical protein